MTGEEQKLKDQVENCAKRSRQGNVGAQNRMEGKVVEGARLQGKESLQRSLLVGIRETDVFRNHYFLRGKLERGSLGRRQMNFGLGHLKIH